MRTFLSDLDHLLRGQFTRPADLRAGKITIPGRNLVIAGLGLGCIYGIFMGIYGATRPDNGTVWQLVASTVKVPLLFLLTLGVSFPSLYVLSALAGSRLMLQETLRLLLAAIAINLALLASLGPVVGFFTLSTQSYAFMVVLNVLVFAASGIAGLVFMRRALVHVFTAPSASSARPAAAEAPPAAAEEPPADEPKDSNAATGLPRRSSPPLDLGLQVFRGWLLVYGVVGAQMGWVLRPFIGAPDLPFTWFREREGNFLQGFFSALTNLFQ